MNLARFITGHINWPTARCFGCLSTPLINCSRAKLFVVASGYWPLEIGRVVGYFLLGHFLACRHIKLYAHTHTPQAFAVASLANRPVDKLRSYGINQLVLAGAFPIPIPLQNSPASAGQLQFISPAPQWEFERKAVPARSSCERVSITKLTEIATYCVVVVVMLLNGHVWWEGRRHPEWAGRCGPAIKLHRKMSSTWRPTTVSNWY